MYSYMTLLRQTPLYKQAQGNIFSRGMEFITKGVEQAAKDAGKELPSGLKTELGNIATRAGESKTPWWNIFRRSTEAQDYIKQINELRAKEGYADFFKNVGTPWQWYATAYAPHAALAGTAGYSAYSAMRPEPSIWSRIF